MVNDGETLNIFEDNYFDLIYSELAFQHMLKPVQESYVKDLYRVLKKEGLFYVQIAKMLYYNDSSFARTKEETNELLKKFNFVYEKETSAYYYIRAEKI